ncbi:MAG: hypothetical protein U5K75_09575 [Ahrensia sp.]|nr:hypothetical protein [Ahrensia sp.]
MTITTRVFAARPSGTSASTSTLTRTLALLMLVLAALSLSACFKKNPIYEWSNKYTITVKTPNGTKSAVSVIGQKLLDRRNNPQFGSGHVWAMATKGEAVVLDLGRTTKGPRYLFALVSNIEYLPFNIARKALDLPKAEYALLAKKFGDVAWPVELKDNYPLLVTFDDIKDPASVKRVDPNDLAAIFGAGYRLVSITLEITNEPVTEGKVESVLGWLEPIAETTALG